MKEIIISLIAFIVAAGVLVLLIGIFGHARVKVTKTTKESYKEGIRFYRPAPYLLITRSAETEQQNK